MFRLEGERQPYAGAVYRGLPTTVCGNRACRIGRNKELMWRRSFLSARHRSSHMASNERRDTLGNDTSIVFLFVVVVLTMRGLWFWLVCVLVGSGEQMECVTRAVVTTLRA